MPTKTKIFRNVKFPPEIIKEANKFFLSFLNEENKQPYSKTFRISIDNDESWSYDKEDEFFAEYRKEIEFADLHLQHYGNSNESRTSIFDFSFDKFMYQSTLSIELSERYMIEKVFEVLESNQSKYTIPYEKALEEVKRSIKIFIGHGKSQQWKDIKDHLHEKHHFEVLAYETGARAGYTITEVLEEMSSEASFALLILTAEDNGADGIVRARENVIHEVGLFQGKLGFKKAIVILEEGCNEFTNISGVQQIRFKKDSIKETYGDVLATIYREFGLTFKQ